MDQRGDHMEIVTFLYLKLVKIHFHVFSLWFILICKIPQCWEKKLLIWTAHHTFLERRQPKVTENPYYVLSPEGRQEKVSAHGLQIF